MWKANKHGIISLVAGLLLLGGIHHYLAPIDEKRADMILSVGICVLLFSVGLVSWLSAMGLIKEARNKAEAEPFDDNAPNDHDD